jgi:hypothetical protein
MAKDLAEEFKKDEKACQQKYSGKTIEVSGKVTDITWQEIQEKAYIRLEKFPDGVQCITIDKQPWAKIAPGQTVKIRGKAADYSFRTLITLEACEVVDSGPNQLEEISTEDLIKKLQADKDRPVDELGPPGHLLVSGEVARIEKGEQNREVVYLKGTDGIAVTCGLDDYFIKKLKPGQKIKLVARAQVTGEGKEIKIHLYGPALPIFGSN